MSRELDKVRQSVDDALVAQDERLPTFPSQWSPPRGFFTFRYSSTEIFSQGGELHVKMREARYENGRFKSEECEGTIDRDAYGRMVSEAQGYFLNQAFGFARLLLAPLQAALSRRRND